MRKTVQIAVIPTKLYHYDIYHRRYKFFIKKIERANISLNNDIEIFVKNSKWKKYSQTIECEILKAHELYKQYLLTKQS